MEKKEEGFQTFNCSFKKGIDRPYSNMFKGANLDSR